MIPDPLAPLNPLMRAYSNATPTDAMQIRAFLTYDSDNGKLIWIRRFPGMQFRDRTVGFKSANIFNAKHAGRDASSVASTGYPMTSILNYPFTAHRIAWLLFYGTWPEHEIDHLNGNRTDFRVFNLRDVPRQRNVDNSRRISSWANTNTGVRQKRGGRWSARIMYKYQEIFIGVFDTRDEAVQARRAKEIELRGAQPWQTP